MKDLLINKTMNSMTGNTAVLNIVSIRTFPTSLYQLEVKSLKAPDLSLFIYGISNSDKLEFVSTRRGPVIRN